MALSCVKVKIVKSNALHKKLKFSLRISSVIKEILNGILHFLCSVKCMRIVKIPKGKSFCIKCKINKKQTKKKTEQNTIKEIQNSQINFSTWFVIYFIYN